MLLTSNRWKHFVAMALIGDGVMAVVQPHRDASAWSAGPRPLRKLKRALNRRPALIRWIGAAQVVVAVYWALKQEQPR